MHSVETKPRPKRNYENHENLEKNLRIEEKKQRLSAKIMTRPIVQSAPNAIDCNV